MLPGLDANPLRRDWLKQFRRAMSNGGAASARSALGVAPASTDNAVARFDGTAGVLQNSLVTVGDTGNVAGVVDFTMTGSYKQVESAARSWAMQTRSVVTTYPVAVMRPETANTVMSMDIMPNGTPVESPGNGYTWFDACSADVRDNNNAVYGARLAVTSALARVASFNYNGATAKPLAFGIHTSDKWYIDATAFFLAPATDNTQSFGTASFRSTVIYAATGAINTSDRREKQDIAPITDAVLDAWAEVEFCTYRWITAVQEKGAAARTHVGLIAQDILEAFQRHGLNAHSYGLFCYDEWTQENEPDEGGGLRLVEKSGNRYGVRAEQCLFLEAALMRRELKRLQG
jgi:hypothetical protein